MAERAEYLFRGRRNPDGSPAEWLDVERGSAPDEAHPEGIPDEPAVPPHHLTKAEYDALSPKNKERVRTARNESGGPLYEKNEAPAERTERTGRAADGGKE